MERAKQHWGILQRVERNFTDKVSEFMVIGRYGEGVVMVTEPDGEGFWFGKMKFGDESKEATEPDGEEFWFGEMEFGTESKEATEPTRLVCVRNLVGMAHGSNHIVLLDRMGTIYAFGDNNCGQLGQGNTNNKHFTPQLIPASPRRFTMVRCGYDHSLALTQDGKVWAWGKNDSGQVGLPSSTSSVPSPRQIAQLDSHRVVAIECGGEHSLALTDQGQVYGWGGNGSGQLAQNGYSSQSTPVRLPCARQVTQIAAGYRHTLLLAADGQVFACGLNDYGQLGLPTSTRSSSSLCQVSGLPLISQIASHFNRNISIALSTDRRCFVWGVWNYAPSHTPLQLPPTYSTIESPLSPYSTHSVRVKGQSVPNLQFPLTSNSGTQTDDIFAPNSFWNRITRMFDNPDSEPDLQFVLGAKSILAHRTVLQLSSANFTALFSESCRAISADLTPYTPSTSFPQSNPTPTRHTTNPSEPSTTSTPPSIPTPHSRNITRIPIHDHSYPAFHAFLGYIYTGRFKVPVDLLPDLYELSHRFQCADLQQLSLSRMLTTLSLSTCCPYFQLADRHQLSQLQSSVVRFVADNPLQVFRTEAFSAMDPELGQKLTLAAANFEPQPET